MTVARQSAHLPSVPRKEVNRPSQRLMALGPGRPLIIIFLFSYTFVINGEKQISLFLWAAADSGVALQPQARLTPHWGAPVRSIRTPPGASLSAWSRAPGSQAPGRGACLGTACLDGFLAVWFTIHFLKKKKTHIPFSTINVGWGHDYDMVFLREKGPYFGGDVAHRHVAG